MPIVISNTTPIISFMKIEGLHILRGIFSEIIISKGVYDELTAKVFLEEEINMINNCDFIKIKEVKNEFAVKLIQKQLNLDLGESEAIVLTNEIKASILIMDERKGRKIAQSMGLNISSELIILNNYQFATFLFIYYLDNHLHIHLSFQLHLLLLR